MIVTDIRKSFNSKKLNEVYIDYEYAFCLYDNEIGMFDIKENGEISEEVFNKICKRLKKNATNDSLKLLLRSDYTKKTIEDKLKIKKYPEDIIKEVIEYLEENGFINDYDYAKHFVKSAFQKGKGAKYIEFELKKRGVISDITEELLSEYGKESKISEAAEKKLRSIQGNKEFPDYKDYIKLKEYLLRQGYSYDEIMSQLSQMKGDYEN